MLCLGCELDLEGGGRGSGSGSEGVVDQMAASAPRDPRG